MSDIDILYQISNLKEAEYKNILLITGLIKLLTEKNIISKSDLIKTINNIESCTENKGIKSTP